MINLTPQYGTAEKGTSAERPTKPVLGQTYLDTTIHAAGEPIFCSQEFDPSGPTDAVWVNAKGETQEVNAPTFTSITPASGTHLGNTAVTIVGNHFGSVDPLSTTAILFGAASATSIVIVDDQHMTCHTPAHAAAAVDLHITNPYGTVTATAAYTFT